MQFISVIQANRGEVFRHEASWCECKLCPLHKHRRKICLWRGYIPCNALFVGEGPGPMENILGYPFVGPAGAKLDQIVEFVKRDRQTLGLPEVDFCYTNLVACYPKEKEGASFRSPESLEISACSDRLGEFIKIINANRVGESFVLIALGQLPAAYLAPIAENLSLPILCTTHPSSIIRQPQFKQTEATLSVVAEISTFLRQYI